MIEPKKIPVEVTVIGDKCKNCGAMEIEKVDLMHDSMFRCKHINICANVLFIWEAEHGKD